jgi:hypothetical protein
MSIDDDPDGARLAAIERDMAQLVRLFGERRHRDKRDGSAILSVRIGDELAALVRRTARQRGCTIADLLRPAIRAAVNQPSTEPLSEFPPAFMPRTLPREASRQALSTSLAEQAHLAAAGAAVMTDRRSRDGRMTEPGMLKELPSFGPRRPK